MSKFNSVPSIPFKLSEFIVNSIFSVRSFIVVLFDQLNSLKSGLLVPFKVRLKFSLPSILESELIFNSKLPVNCPEGILIVGLVNLYLIEPFSWSTTYTTPLESISTSHGESNSLTSSPLLSISPIIISESLLYHILSGHSFK